MTRDKVEAIRKRAWHYLSHETATAASMTLGQLQQFVVGAYHPTDAQLAALARILLGNEKVA